MGAVLCTVGTYAGDQNVRKLQQTIDEVDKQAAKAKADGDLDKAKRLIAESMDLSTTLLRLQKEKRKIQREEYKLKQEHANLQKRKQRLLHKQCAATDALVEDALGKTATSFLDASDPCHQSVRSNASIYT